MQPRYFILALIVFASGILEAQTPHFQQYFLTRKNESIQVNKMFQSREGYMWFATNKGLFRFDGQAYKSYGLADSLPDLNVTAITQDSLGRIWTAHGSGRIAFYSNNQFHRFNPQEGLSAAPVSDIVFDSNNVLWFSTHNDGLYYFKRNRLYRLDEEDGMPDLYIYDIEPSRDGRIFAGTDGGMVIATPTENDININVINNKDGLRDNIIRKIHLLDNNTMLLGSEDEGVIHFNPRNNTFQNLTSSLTMRSVSDIVVSADKAWISSAQAGLTVIDLISGKLKHYSDENGKSLPTVTCLLQDLESNIWAGSRSGVFRTLGNELEFISVPIADRDPNVMAVARDQQGSVWFSTQDGLFRRTNSSIDKSVTEDILKGTAFERYRVISLYVDDDGYVWAGLYGEGVLRIHPLTRRVTLISKQLRNGNVLSISRGGKNVVWLATLGGAERIEVSGEQLRVTHFSTENGLSSDFIYQVFVDSENQIWFGTDGKGVDRLNAKGFEHFESGLASKIVYGFAEDGNGRIWVNTQDAGVFYFDGTTFKDSRTENAGFRELNNFALTSDHGGRIVAMHNAGIDIYDPSAKEIRYLDDQSGLESKIANLNSVSRDAEHNLLFGTSNGIVFLGYNPARKTYPRVHIEGVSAVGKKRSPERHLTIEL